MMEMILVKLITLAGPPSVGKTSVILRLIEVLHKEKQKAGVIKFDCLTTFDKEPYEKANIPIQIGLSGKFCPDHFFISNIEEAVAWGKKSKFRLFDYRKCRSLQSLFTIYSRCIGHWCNRLLIRD